jgi:hypothetical protein
MNQKGIAGQARSALAPRVYLRFAAAIILASALSPSAACRRTGPPAAQTGAANQNGATTQSNLDHAAAVDRGDLKLVYKARGTPKPGSAVGSNPEVLAQIVTNLNEHIALPWDITIQFQDCDEPDAYYDPDTRSLTMCYQLIDEYYDLFARKIKDKTKLDDAVRGAVASTFFHELGHGLVDAWKLPITGKEEDAVDQLSTLVLINHTTHGEEMALNGALSFKLYAELDKGQAKIYWDEHSLDEQRFYDTICIIYGHAPDKYAYLVKDGTLPEERAELCREDYPRVARAWQQLLEPFRKQPAAGEAVSPSALKLK